MKKYGTLIALVLAVACGALAVWLTSELLRNRTEASEQAARDAVPLGVVVIAAQDLEIGTTLSAENLKLVQWPKPSIPRGAFENVEAVAGRVAVTRLSAGEPLLDPELAEPGSGVGLVAMIAPGSRAMSVRVNEVSGVAGFILPNTYVDIIAVEGMSQQKQTAKTILRRIKVLATAQETSNEKGKAKIVNTVTLELQPKEAETMALYSVTSSIHMILRNPLDTDEEAPVVAQAETKKPAKPKAKYVAAPKPTAAAPAPPPEPAPYTVEVIKGSKAPQAIKFKDANSDERR